MIERYLGTEKYLNLKECSDLLYKTLELVSIVFSDKTDKEGLPYFNHLLKVYMGVDNYNEKIIALLHDIVEDTDITSDDLLDFGYSKEIVDVVLILTKKKGEYYPDYIDRIINSNNIMACNVKLSDLKHNMDLKRIKNPTVNDMERVTKRYMPAYNRILEKIEGSVK